MNLRGDDGRQTTDGERRENTGEIGERERERERERHGGRGERKAQREENRENGGRRRASALIYLPGTYVLAINQTHRLN